MAISKMYNKMKIDLQNTTHKNKDWATRTPT